MIDADREVSPPECIRAGGFLECECSGFRPDSGYPAIDLGIRCDAVSHTES